MTDRNRGGRPSNAAREAARLVRLQAIVARGSLEAAEAALALARDSSVPPAVRLQSATLLASLAERGVVPLEPTAPADPAAASESVKLLGEVLRRMEARGDQHAGLVLLPREIESPEPPEVVPAPFSGKDHGAAGGTPPAAAAPDSLPEAPRLSSSDETVPTVPPEGWTNTEAAAAKRKAYPDFVNDTRSRLSLVPLANRKF